MVIHLHNELSCARCDCAFCRFFFDPRTKSHEFLQALRYLWILPAIWIREYNLRNCTCCIPDWAGGRGTKVRPFLGCVLIVEEGGVMNLMWWKHLHRYQPDPEMVLFEEKKKAGWVG